MTPAAFYAYAKAVFKEKKASREFIDRVIANQTAFLVNAQLGNAENPCPLKPDRCMAFDWASTEKETIEEEPAMNDKLQEIRNKMKVWVSATGGQNG